MQAMHGSDDITTPTFWNQVNAMIKCAPKFLLCTKISFSAQTLNLTTFSGNICRMHYACKRLMGPAIASY